MREYGYAPCWPFRVRYEKGEWHDDMNPFVGFLWQYFIAPFWDGTIKVKK